MDSFFFTPAHFHQIEYLDFIIRMGVAIFAGFVIGFERQWINRVTGIQTNVLVSTGACIFILGANFVSYEGQAASRIAAQIVSGIGFLGAGMIFRNGFTTHGINTAATIWCAAAIGVLSGMGLIIYALICAAILVLANVIFRWMDHFINSKRKWVDLRLVKNFEIQVLLSKENLKDIRSKIISTIKNSGEHHIFSVRTNVIDNSTLKISVSFKTHHKDYSKVQESCDQIELIHKDLVVDWSEIKD